MKTVARLKDQARLHEQREEWDKAIQAYEQALQQMDDEEGEIELHLFNRIGDLHLRLGRQADAVRCYEDAADRYAAAGFYNNAIALCNKALRYMPDRAEIYLKLGRYSGEQGFFTDARRWFLEYAQRMERAGRLEQALRALEEFADISGDAEIRELLGQQYEVHGNVPAAVAQYRRAMEIRFAAGEAAAADALRARILTLDPSTDVSLAPSEPTTGEGEGRAAGATRGAADPLPGLELHIEEGPTEPDAAGVETLPEPANEAEVEDEAEGDLALVPTSRATDEANVDLGFEPTHLAADEADATDDGATLIGTPDSLDVQDEEPSVSRDGEAWDALEDSLLYVPGDDFGDDAGDDVVDDVAEDADDDLLGAVAPELADDTAYDPLDELGADPLDDLETNSLAGLETDPLDAPAADPLEDLTSDPLDDLGGDPLDDLASDPLDDLGPDPLEHLETGPLDAEDHDPFGAADHDSADLVAYESTAVAGEDLDASAPIEEDDLDTLFGSDVGAESAVDPLPTLEDDPFAGAPWAAASPDVADVDVEGTAVTSGFDDAFGHDLDDALAEPLPLLDGGWDEEPATVDSIPDTGDFAWEQTAGHGSEEMPWAVAQDAGEPEYVDLSNLVNDELEAAINAGPASADEDSEFARLLSQFRKKAIEREDDGDPGSHYDLGLAFKEMGLIDEAIAEFEKALRGGENELKIHEELGRCFMLKGEYDLALRALGRAQRLHRVDEHELLGVYYLIGRCHEELGDRDAARAAFEQVVALAGDFNDVAERLARL